MSNRVPSEHSRSQAAEGDSDVSDQLVDSMADAQPVILRLRELLAERGWVGWTRIERQEP